MPHPMGIYDRPTVSLTNLTSGNPSASLQALFSPDQLSPEELKNFRERLLRNNPKAAKNPFVKTVLDLSTNPLIWLGAAMALMPGLGSVANSKQMMALWSKGGKFVKSANMHLAGTFSPFTSTRAIHHTGIWDELVKFVDRSSEFTHTMAKEMDDALVAFKATAKSGRLTERQRILLYAKTAGWDKPFKMVRAVDDEAAAALLAAGKKVPMKRVAGTPMQQYYNQIFPEGSVLAENLDKVIRQEDPALFDLASRIRNIYDKAKVKLRLDDIEILNDLALKGADIAPDYAPQITGRTALESVVFRWSGARNARKSYEKAIRQITKNYTPGMLNQRMGQSLPQQKQLDLIQDALTPGMYKKITALEGTQVKEFKKVMWNMATSKEDLSPEALRKMMDYLNPSAVQRLEAAGQMPDFLRQMQRHMISIRESTNPADAEKMIAQLAGALGAPARYSMDAVEVTRRYSQVAGPAYAWYSKGGGKTITSILNDPGIGLRAQLEIPGTQVRSAVDALTDSIIPMLRGLKDPKEWVRQQKWLNTAYNGSLWLTKDGPTQRMIPKPMRKWLLENLSGQAGSLSEKTIGGAIASSYYSGALGTNLSPVSKNLLQNFITTLPMLGTRATASGFTRVIKDIPELLAQASKVGFDDAMKNVFPEYYTKFGAEGIASAMASGDIMQEMSGMTGRTMGAWGKVKAGMMMPFASSEKFNRLWAFYSGHAKAISDGMDPGMATEFARRITMQTQFTGGVLGLPNALRGTWQPLRQFMHFPMRYGEFLYGSMRMGPDPKVRSLGVLGRSLVGSASAYTIAKNMLGMDISGGLMAGAIPSPGYENSPFYPFPFVPPIASQAGELVKSVYSGDFSRLPSAAMLSVPSGLAIRRGFKTWSPKYADYKNRSVDGRIPVYNDKNMLIGNMTPMQLIMRGIGLKPAEMQSEQDMMKYLMTHRDKIRTYRREYLEALTQNDLEQAEKINKEFQKKYKGLGPLRVKKSDIKAVQNRHTISRLNRVLKGFSKDDRPLFQDMVNQATLTQFARDIDSDPSGQVLANYLE